MDLCLGILEVQGLGPTFVIADQVLKVAWIQIPGIELNSLGGLTIKIVGDAQAVTTAVEYGDHLASELHVSCTSTLLLGYPQSAHSLIHCEPRYSLIIEDRTQLLPTNQQYRGQQFAIGFLETQGFIGMVAAADAMLKATDVSLIGKEKIGATYVDVMVKGDLSSVREALEAGQVAADVAGTFVGSYVIARPHPDLLALLPE